MINAIASNFVVGVLIYAFMKGDLTQGFWMWGLIGSGGMLNAFVMELNGDRMPVIAMNADHLTKIQASARHYVADRDTKLVILGDIIPIPGVGMASIGDLLIFAGLGYAAWYLA